MYNTYVVEGGIGKNAAFTSLIPKLSNKENIQVVSPYMDCFSTNPNVSTTFDLNLGIDHSSIINSSKNIHFVEPYKSNFVFGKQHLIESWSNLLGVEYDDESIPSLYTDQYYDKYVRSLREYSVNNKYMLVQLTGGQPPAQYLSGSCYEMTDKRSYPNHLAQKLIHLLKKKYPDVTILDATLPNQPSYDNAIKYDVYWILLHEALKHAEGFISIDSCLNHFSPSAKVPGVVLWGSTRWTQFGYSQNTNMQYFMKPNKWEESKYDPDDPRNIMIDPERVLNEYVKTQKNKGIIRNIIGQKKK